MKISRTTIKPSVKSDPYYNNVSLLLSMNGSNNSTSFVDASPNQKTVTVTGDVQISTAQSKFGGSSAFFDGLGAPSDYLSVLSSSDFDFGGGIAFTVEGWFYPQSTNINLGLFGQRISGVYCPFEIMQYSTGFTWLIANASVNSWLSSGAFGSGSLPLNTWTHVALVGNGTTLQLYANGISRISIAQPAWTSGNWPMYIGQSGDGVKFQGHIDDFRVTKGIARYTSNFTPPTRAFPTQAPSLLPPYKIISRQVADPFYDNVSLLLKMDGANGSTTFTDSSPTPKTVTRNGDVIISNARINPRIGVTSAYFDGTGDFLTIPSNTDFVFGTGSFTIECWINLPVTPSGSYAAIIDHRASAGALGAVLFGVNSSRQLTYYTFVSSNSVTINSTSLVPLNQWTHVALVRGTDLITRFFINGVLDSTTVSDTDNKSTVTTLYIGRVYDNAHPAFNGYMDDIRVTKGVARYTSNFTPPIESFPAFGPRTFRMPLAQSMTFSMNDLSGVDFNTTATIQMSSIYTMNELSQVDFNTTATTTVAITMTG